MERKKTNDEEKKTKHCKKNSKRYFLVQLPPDLQTVGMLNF